jgi:hypothetical protein
VEGDGADETAKASVVVEVELSSPDVTTRSTSVSVIPADSGSLVHGVSRVNAWLSMVMVAVLESGTALMVTEVTLLSSSQVPAHDCAVVTE